MYYYFSAGFPSAVKINGTFLGLISDSVKFCNIDTIDAFIEICSLSPLEPSVNFLLNDNFLSSPPENISVTDLKGGYLIKCNPLCKGKDFRLLAQKKESDFAVSVFNDNGLKVSIETPFDFFADELRLNAVSAEIEKFYLSSHPFLLINLRAEKNYIAVYSLSGGIKKHLFLEVDNYETTNNLTVTIKKTDIAKHEVITTYDFDGEVKVSSIKSCTDENFSIDKLPPPVIPFAFLEEILARGNISNYLTDSVNQNADKLQGYLGDFLGVFPPPIFRNDDEVGLIYKLSDNKYGVEYFTFELENRKICNIKKSAK